MLHIQRHNSEKFKVTKSTRFLCLMSKRTYGVKSYTRECVSVLLVALTYTPHTQPRDPTAYTRHSCTQMERNPQRHAHNGARARSQQSAEQPEQWKANITYENNFCVVFTIEWMDGWWQCCPINYTWTRWECGMRVRDSHRMSKVFFCVVAAVVSFPLLLFFLYEKKNKFRRGFFVVLVPCVLWCCCFCCSLSIPIMWRQLLRVCERSYDKVNKNKFFVSATQWVCNLSVNAIKIYFYTFHSQIKIGENIWAKLFFVEIGEKPLKLYRKSILNVEKVIY